LQHLAG